MQQVRNSMERPAVVAQRADDDPSRELPGPSGRHHQGHEMDDAKRTHRETEEKTKEAWRNRDGEDLADMVGNVGDEVRKDLGNLGDDLTRRPRRLIDDPSYPPSDLDRPR